MATQRKQLELSTRHLRQPPVGEESQQPAAKVPATEEGRQPATGGLDEGGASEENEDSNEGSAAEEKKTSDKGCSTASGHEDTSWLPEDGESCG